MSPPSVNERELALRYGVNPHQTPARALARGDRLPFRVLGGAPSYVNLLDALSAWQLVRELDRALGVPAAASFKHVSPAGAAVATPLDETTRDAALVPRADELSPLASAYARARGADRLASFGDMAALSERCDVPTARLLAREASDGVVAPGYEAGALALLRRKKEGRYLVLEIDPAYEPPHTEGRELFGVRLEQRRDDAPIGPPLLMNLVTREKRLPDDARRDLLVALLVTKYTQSNSICLARDGQAVGVGAGQQSRIDCTRLACEKADRWWLRRHPKVRALSFAKATSRPDRDNRIDAFVRDGLTIQEKVEWAKGLTDVAMASDGFFPFRDSIDRAARSGVRYVAQPGGSRRDDEVIKAADERNMLMAMTGVRLFHH